MFFHIDESGNTGMNLFDGNQPRLSYGVLSSRLNVDALGSSAHKEMTGRLGVEALHANEMGVGGLAKIEDVLYALQRKFRFGLPRGCGRRCSPTPPCAQTSVRTTTIRQHTERGPATTAQIARLRRSARRCYRRCEFVGERSVRKCSYRGVRKGPLLGRQTAKKTIFQ